MDITAYVRLFRRWVWLIVPVAIGAASLAFIIMRIQPPQYEASTTVQVGPAVEIANPDTGMLQVGQQLALTYAALIKTFPVLDATVKALNLPFSADELEKKVTTRIITSTSLLVITVNHTDQVVAADIANELARQLILNSPTNLSKDQQDQQNLLQTEIKNAEAQLQTSRDELATLDTRLAATLTPADRADAQALRTTLVTQVNSAQANLAQFTNTLATLQRQNYANTLTVVERARVPENPVGTSAFVVAMLAALLGGVLAAGIALFFEYMRDSIRLPSEVAPLLGTTLLGAVTTFGKKGTLKDKLIVWTQPRSTVAEAYRALRVSLSYAVRKNQEQEPYQVYAITSPGPGDGKSVTTANLAIAFANTGLRVILLDADLRKPVQHLLFNVSNVVGLANLLVSSSLDSRDASRHGANHDVAPAREVMPPRNREIASDTLDQTQAQVIIDNVIQKTIVPGLDIIPAGQAPSNPSELLGTVQVQELVQYLLNTAQYEVIIFDTPPALAVSDTSVLASTIKANLVVVVQSGRTRRGAAVRTIQQLTDLMVPVAGVILNRLSPQDVDAGYGYYYFNYYGHENTQREQNSPAAPSENGKRPTPAMANGRRSHDDSREMLDDDE